MSDSAFRNKVSKKLLENYTREREKTVAEAARILLQSADVQQCLVLTEAAVTQFQRGLEAGIGRKLKGGQISSYRTNFRNFIEGQAKPFPDKQDTKTQVFKTLVKKNKLKFGVNIFYMPYTFDTLKQKVTEFNKNYFEEKLNGNRNKYDAKAQGRTTHLDHGADGVASGIFGGVIGAFSTLQDDDEINFSTFSRVLESNLEYVWSQGLNSLTKKEAEAAKAEVMKLITFAEQVISEGGDLRAGLSMLLTPIDAKINLGRGSQEQEIQDAFLKAFEMTFEGIDYLQLEGSSTLYQKIEKFIVIDKFEKTLGKSLNVKVTSNQSRSTKLKTKTKTKTKSSEGKGKKITPARIRGKKATAARAKKSAENVRLAARVGMINQKLPQTIKKNMNPPRLQNRTGRFAESVKVVDFIKTPKGFPSLGYTYQKSPYQTFEVGFRQGSNERDPRKLIDFSIRQIAAEAAFGRFFTRRI